MTIQDKITICLSLNDFIDYCMGNVFFNGLWNARYYLLVNVNLRDLSHIVI